LPRPLKERNAEPLLEHLDLVAHRRLRHAEFGGGDREILVPGRSFENPDGCQWREVAHRVRMISLSYDLRRAFSWTLLLLLPYFSHIEPPIGRPGSRE